MFRVNDYVFYGSGGICKITDIQTAPLAGMPADRRYYIMQSLADKNGVIYVPVDSEGVFLRSLLTRDQAEQLIDEMEMVERLEESDNKLLRAKYTELMRLHDPREWVRIIKTVRYRIEHAPRVSETERTVAENAKRFLHTELSLALDIPEQDIENHILARVQKMA